MDKQPNAKRPETDGEPADAQAEHRWRMRQDWDNLIEDLIQDGMERGVFENLPGKGRPLNLNQNPYEAEMALANTLLKQNDLRPAWINHRMAIVQKIETLRRQISPAWKRQTQAFRLAQGEIQRRGLTAAWEDTCRQWQTTIEKINREIDEFNLRRPSNRLEMFKLRLEDELQRAGASRRLEA